MVRNVVTHCNLQAMSKQNRKPSSVLGCTRAAVTDNYYAKTGLIMKEGLDEDAQREKADRPQ
jgi:hypothetical protein